jgi:hypothetical protein
LRGTEDDKSFNVTATVTDAEGESVQGTISVLIDDDTPVVFSKTDLIYSNTLNDGAGPLTGGTGIFDYSIGADSRSSYSGSNTDFAGIALTGTVGSNAITGASVTWVSEDANGALFNVQFTYQPNPTSSTTATATGTVSFDKVNGTYSVELNAPIDSFSISTTSHATSFTGYAFNSDTTVGSNPPVSVAKLADNFYVQFSGMEEGRSRQRWRRPISFPAAWTLAISSRPALRPT